MDDGNGGAAYSGEADTSTFSENAEWHLVRWFPLVFLPIKKYE